MNIPIIRLEVESMKHSMLTALTDYSKHIDASIRNAVEAYCTPENIDAVVKKEASRALDIALREEVWKFFQDTGHGRIAVKEAVMKHLDRLLGVNSGESGAK